MRKALPAAAFTLALLFSALAAGNFVKLGAANPFYEERRTDPPVISIHSPVNGTNVNSALLNFTVTKPEWWVGTPGSQGLAQTLNSVVIEIDGKYYGGASGFDSSLATPFDYAASLTNLADGHHNLTVRAYATGFVVEIHGIWKYSVPVNSSSIVYFTLDTISPRVSVMSMENKKYDDTDLSLNFTVNEPCSQFSYVLDGQENVTVAGNTTLAGLSIGAHNVTVYAWDAAGNVGASEIMTFTVAEPEPQPEPFPAAPVVAASAASAAAVGVALLVYFKKRKH